MASFSKTFPVPGKDAAAIYSAVSSGIEHFLSKTPLGSCEIQRNEPTKSVSFKASMASGTLIAQENGLKVDVSLSLLASPFKGKVEEGISKWISKTFGG